MQTIHLNPATTSEESRIAAVLKNKVVWIVLLATAITYLGTLQFEFVFDDYGQILFNPFVKAWRYVPEYFASSVWKRLAPTSPGIYYRPLFLLLMRINYAIFTNRPLGWHMAAIALHLVVTWLTFVLARKLTGDFTVAWLAALIFGVHPIHHEVVAWISGMTESLFAIFFLASFLAYLKSLEDFKKTWIAVSCVFYALALLSKETAIILPALVFAHAWISRGAVDGENRAGNINRNRFSRALISAAYYLPVAVFYLLVRRKVLSGLGHSLTNLSFASWLLTLPSVLFFYVRHWFFPARLAESYDLFAQPKLNILHVLLPAVIVIAVCIAIWSLRTRLDARSVGYAAAWVVIPLLPALDIFVFGPQELVHDRYFYVPSIGAALLMALMIVRVVKSKRSVFGQPLHVVVAGLILTVSLSLLTTRASSFWINDYSLFSRAHQIAPMNATAASSLGAELLSRGDFDAASVLLEEAYRQHPGDYRIAYNLGRVSYAKRQFAQAVEYTQQAIALSPNYSDAYVSLGVMELKQGRRADAQQSMRRAVELGPFSAPAHTSYGIVLAMNGDCSQAMTQFEAALALSPGEGLTQREMARCRASLTPSATTKPGQL
jgi:protein O-mannosyl-transferase